MTEEKLQWNYPDRLLARDIEIERLRAALEIVRDYAYNTQSSEELEEAQADLRSIYNVARAVLNPQSK